MGVKGVVTKRDVGLVDSHTHIAVTAGSVALDASNPTSVTTGLATILGAAISENIATAPGVATSIFTWTATAGVLNIYAWKVTSSADTTLIASTGTETVGWIAIGT